MSLSPDYLVVSKQCPELYEALKIIFASATCGNIKVVSGDIKYLREKNNKSV